MSKDNLSSLYNGLIKKGYSVEDIGDEATFRTKMADKNNRKQLYDYVSSRGDFRIGDYDSYEKRLTSVQEEQPQQTGQPQQQTEIPAVVDTAQVQAPELPAADTVQQQVEKPLPKARRQSLREQVGGGMAIAVPDDVEMAAKFADSPQIYDPNANIQRALAEGKLDTIINEDEEKRISAEFKPKPVVNPADIYENYSNRFSLTERGKELSSELAGISQEIQNRYANEFLSSNEFKNLQKQYKGEELDKKANEAFSRAYSDKIDNELQPYVKAYLNEAYSRYGQNIEDDVAAYNEDLRRKTKDQIAADVSSLDKSVNAQLEENHRKLSARAGTGGSAFNALMGSASYNAGSAQDRKAKAELEAARQLVDESNNIISEARKKGKTNFVAGLGRGISDAVFDANTWSFGLQDMRDASVLVDALNKFDRGEALTESEQTLMDAAVANMAVNAYYYSDLGRGYKAGTVSGQSIPFMLEFAINPVSASGSAIAKNILKYGMKKFGKSAVKNNAAKFAARLVGDAAAAAAMTGTSSAARVAAGTMERAGGDIQLDESGTGYAGRTGQMGTGEALGKSFASTFLENQSEMVFNAFSGLGSKIWKTAERYVPGGTAAIMDNAVMGKAGEIYRKIKSNPTLKEVARRTQFHGLGEEYLEEVYNNFANIPLGEMTLEEATDLDNNIDTFLGLAPTSVAFGIVGLGGLAAQKAEHRKKLKAAFGNMTRIEKNRLAKLEELAEKGGNEDIKTFIRETMLDTSLTPEEKKAEIEYAYNLAVGNAIDDVEAAQQEEVAVNNAAASEEGAAIYAEHNPETMRQTVLRREVAEQRLVDAGFSIDKLKATPVNERQELLSRIDEENTQLVVDFFDAYDREEAMNEALDTAHEEEVSQARSMLQDIVLPNRTVTVVPLGQYGTEQAQYGVVVSGIDAQGNPTQSNGAVVTYPVQMVNGTPDFSTIGKGNPIVAIPKSYTDAMVFSPDEAFNGMLTAYQQDAAILEGTPIAPGAQFPVMLDDGSMQNVTVAGTAPTGESVVVLPDGKTVSMTAEELSTRKRNAELAPIMAEQAEEEQIQQQAVQEAATAGYSDEVRNLQPQAGEKLVVNGRNAAIKEVAPDGIIVDYLSEGGDITGTDIVPLETYYDYKQSQFNQQNNVQTQSDKDTADSVQETTVEGDTADSSGDTTAAEEVQQSEETDYPVDEAGEPAFLQMQPQRTVQLLTDTFAEDAASFVADRLSAAQKAAEKAAKKSPKALGFNERAKELSQIRQEREDAAREVEYWQNISSLMAPEVQPQQTEQPQQVEEKPKAQTQASAPNFIDEAEEANRKNQERLAAMTEEEIAAAQAKVQENIDKGRYDRKPASRRRSRYNDEDVAMGEAYTPMEHVLREIATGRITFQWSDKGATQGLGSHLGLSGSNTERQKLIWALSGEGYAPEVAAEIIHSDMPSAMQELVTDQDVSNMILDAFSQYGSPSRMFEAAQQLHGNDIESQPGYEEDMERQQLEWEAYHNNMSVEDWTTLVDIIEEELEYQFRTLTDEDINAIFEEIYNEEYGTGRNEIEGTEGTEQSTDSEGGNEVQPQQQSDNETADGRSEVRPEETAPSDEQGGGTLSQPGFTVEKRYHQKDNKDIFAVNFTERMGRESFLAAKKKAKDAGGYYSSFGKGGFIFDTEEAANNFAQSIVKLSERVDQDDNNAFGRIYSYIDNALAGVENPLVDVIIEDVKKLSDDELNKAEEYANKYKGVGKAKQINLSQIKTIINAEKESRRFSENPEEAEAEAYQKMMAKYENHDLSGFDFDSQIRNRERQIAEYEISGNVGMAAYSRGLLRAAQDMKERVLSQKQQSQAQQTIEAARAQVDQNPTEAQKEAGNYRKGHITIDGYNITLENPKGSERSGTDKDGNKWSVTMNNDYGYIRGTEGVDGDHIDVFLSDNPESGKVFVVDQVNEDGSFDEHKVMYGFDTRQDAIEAYLANYSPGWTGLGQITEVSKDQFKKWIESSHRKTKPFAEYKSMTTPKKPEEVNGYRKGDKVYYGGKTATIYDFEDDGRPVLDTGLAPVLYTVADWADISPDISPITENFGKRLTNKSGDKTIAITKYDGAKQTVQMLINGKEENLSANDVINMLRNDEWTEAPSQEPKQEKKSSGMKQISVEGLFNDLKTKGSARFADNVIEDTPAYGSQNKVVSTARYEELKKKMRAKLNNLNAGYDPEIMTIGAEMAAYHIEAGARTFIDFARRMIADMGDDIRPYLKMMYGAARHFPGMEEYKKTMTPESEYDEIDINSIKLEEDGQTGTDTNTVEVQQEEKPADGLSGDSAEYQERTVQESKAVAEIGRIIRDRALASVEGNNVEPLSMKDVKKILGGYTMLSDMSATDMQELVELAMTNETRNVALEYINSDNQKLGYDLVLAMYNMQPLLNARDSTRFERQQYSTPTPFGYVMGQFAQAGKRVGSVLEPSAGNGALTITFPSSIVHVNDIDERRLANLRTLGYGEVTNQDALIPFGDSVDVVMTNPPFGSTTTKELDNGQFKINSLEGLMAINALESMKDDGRAAIVIGGNTSYRENGAMQNKDMRLFSYLYTHYNVVDVINLDGEMYKRNGTKYDVRIILINGRKPDASKIVAPPVKSKARAEQVKSFDELYNRIQDDIRRIQQVESVTSGTEGKLRTSDTSGGGESRNVGNSGNIGERRRPAGGSQELGTENNVAGTETASSTGSGRQGTANVEGLDNGNRPDAGSTGNVPGPQQVAERGGSTESTDERAARPDTTDRGDNTGRSRLTVSLGDEKVSYPNRSRSGTLMSVVPANQAQVLADSLADIGDVDQFLVDELGYSSKDELFGYLAAEQIDSVSLAINQMSKGNGFIIGDMTGVGKGRQGAALIRYAVRKGYKPIYFTQEPALFSDNYRDLADIGSGELRPFIIGSDPKNATITDAAGNVVHKLPSDKERKRVYDYILKNGTLPDEYDYVITTYSQINNGTKEYEAADNGITSKDKSYKKKSPSPADRSGQERRDVIEALSRDNIMILDESHTAGGSGGGSMFMQYIMPGVKGVTFLSATFAKRADNMPIYAMKTDLAKSGITQQELIEAIAQGGVTLQEIMSKQLVQSGQMIRRERSFNGVTIDWLSVSDEEDAVQRKQFDEVSAIFSDIRAFQKDYINPLVESRSEELADEGGYSDLQKGTVDLGASNTPFASKMYNLVNQLLFSLKADAVANRVIDNLKNGFKPVISFTNTMEGFLDEAPKDTPMDVVPNFSLTLLKALDGVMRYTETDIKGEKVNMFYTPEQLGEDGKKKYYEIKDKIENLSANLPISPMDAIKTKIEEAGYKVGEITGRNLEMVRNEDGKYVVRNRKDKDKKSAARDFNNGQIDVLMINKSGSTGISLHASPKFQDQRQRVMVFAQFQSDINDEVQMRGRIDRTGQIYRGKYEYIMSSIPAEQRLQMMFKAKLKSLDANTTSSQKSKFNEMQVTDFLNKYGDEVTWQYMVEHPELSEKLGDPLNLLADNGTEVQVDETSKEKMKDSAAKIARYLPFLPVKEQEEVFKEITDAYAVKIQLLNDAGENDLEITTMPLKAKTLSRKIWKAGAEPNSGNAFADNTYIEEVEVDVLKKPMKADEIKKESERLSEGKPFNEWRQSKTEEINRVYNSKVESLKEKLQKSLEEKLAKAKDSYVKKSKEARDKGKNEFTDEEIDRMSDVMLDDIKAKANEGFIKQKNAIEARRDNVLKILDAFEPLKPLIIPTNLEEETTSIDIVRGTFVGFKFSKDYSPSSSTAVFATLDGRRKVEIPLKDSKAFNIIRMNTLMQPTYLQSLNIDTWDSFVPTQTRKKAYIVTGNLLQALVDVKKSEKARGYLVSYSTEEGETRQGMLMSESFQPSDLTTSAPIRSRLEQIKRGETVVSEDKRVIVEKNAGWRGGYSVRVPKSKKQGGEFFEDKTLRSLVYDNEFTSKGGYMTAEFDETNLPKVLNRLSNLGVKVADKAKLKDAKDEDIRFRTEDSEIRFRSSSDLTVDISEDLESLINEKPVKREPTYHADNIGSIFYSMSGKYMKKLPQPKDRHVLTEGTIDIDKAMEVYNKVLPVYEDMKNELIGMIPDASMAARREIAAYIEAINNNIDYYKELSEGKDVWRTRPLYRFELTEEEKEAMDYVLDKIHEEAAKLNITVTVYTSIDEVPQGAARRALERGLPVKGWYHDGQIAIFLPNATGMEDIKATILHEGVAHYGLRKMIGEKNFNAFMDGIYAAASPEVRKEIVRLLPKYNYNMRIAVEEYLATLAESGTIEPTFWEKVKQLFRSILENLGFTIELTDNDLRYLLWESRNNLRASNSPIDVAKETMMRKKLGIGMYGKKPTEDLRMRFIGEIGAANLDKYEEATTRLDNLSVAREMENAGKDAKAIKIATGWERGADGKWRYETKDIQLEPFRRIALSVFPKSWLRELPEEQEGRRALTLEDILKQNKTTEELFAAYPKLLDTKVKFIGNKGSIAYYDPENNVIMLNFSERKEMFRMNKYLNHEIQHAIQIIEGFASGGGFDTKEVLSDEKVIKASEAYEAIKEKIENYPYKSEEDKGYKRLLAEEDELLNDLLYEKYQVYIRLAGEVEAHNVEARYNMSEKQRRNTLASETEDVAREDQIFIYDNLDENNSLTRFRFEERPALIKSYDAAIDNRTFRFQEAFQDSMLSLKVLQELIEKQTGMKARSFENAYTAENRLSSVNKVDNERYLENFFKPLLEQIDKLAKMSDRQTVEDYIYAKSGLERNELFLNREADKILNEKTKELDESLATGSITQKQYDKELKELEEARDKFIAEGKDYSGLTGLVLKEYEDELNSMSDEAARAKREKEIEKEYKNHAENIVSEFENLIPSAEVDKLWQLIKAANDENLRKQFDSGMLSAEKYEELRNMMPHYVPLRGWEESIAEDFYDYTRKESPVQKEKVAKGRKSLADNPIANIALSAQNAIILGNRNKMKQRFFNFVVNRPNELVTIRDQWYAKTIHTVHDQMEPVYPDIEETDDSATIQRKLEDFENNMKSLEEQGLARRKRMPLGVELKMKSGQKPEHMASVMINGQEYVMYINGNPRAAQALNGKTNPEGEENIFWEYYNKAKRLYGGGLTSNNPDFVAANFVRDSIHSATMQFLNNGIGSSARFVLNTPKSFKAVFRGVMGKYKPGSKTDQYFQEFIQNGGETGYTAIHTIEDYKREYEKALNEVKGFKVVASAGKKGLEGIIKALEVANRIAEDVNRFNAYMSSREAGKTIEESIDAAKNITVNFNKKGALGKGKGAWAALAWFMNKWILFFNPAVQGLYQVGQSAAKNKKRVAGTLATIAASGFIMPYLNALLVSAFGGDDKDDYFYQTDYTRMNNWLIFTGNGYAKIPLPPFFREIYGMGDVFYRLMTNRITPERAAVATLRQLQSAIGFINLIPEGEPSIKEAVSGIMPDLIAPLMDVALNRDFTGRDIAKDTEWTKNLPEYERIYKGVSPVYVEFSRILNQIGGDDARRSPLFGTFINPAYMEHLITSYTGGIGRTISNLTGAAVDLATGEADNIEFRTIPIINRFGSPVTERSITASVNRVFYDYLDRYEAMKVAEKRYKQFIKDGRTEYRDELEQMKNNGEIELIRYFSMKMKTVRKLQDILKDNPDNKKVEQRIIELKSEMVLKAKNILK